MIANGKSSDSAVLEQPTPSADKPFVQMDLDLFYRRKRLLILHYSGAVNSVTLRALAKQLTENYGSQGIHKKVAEFASRRDYDRRAKWEPFIWANWSASDDGKDVLKFLELARENAIRLMQGADNDSAKVGAARTLAAVVKIEVELRQSLGLLPRVNMEPQVKIDNVVQVQQKVELSETTELLKRYEFLFKGDVSARVVQADGSGEQVDKVEAANHA
jgi:hypothetical protein